MDNRNYQRQSDIAIQVMTESVTQLKSDFTDMRHDLKEALKEFSDSVAKLVVMDEKIIHTNLNLERILKIAEKSHDRIDKLQEDCSAKYKALEERLDVIEKDQPLQRQVVTWVTKALWAAAGLAAMFVAKSVGLL